MIIQGITTHSSNLLMYDLYMNIHNKNYKFFLKNKKFFNNSDNGDESNKGDNFLNNGDILIRNKVV